MAGNRLVLSNDESVQQLSLIVNPRRETWQLAGGVLRVWCWVANRENCKTRPGCLLVDAMHFGFRKQLPNILLFVSTKPPVQMDFPNWFRSRYSQGKRKDSPRLRGRPIDYLSLPGHDVESHLLTFVDVACVRSEPNSKRNHQRKYRPGPKLEPAAAGGGSGWGFVHNTA